MKTVKETSDSSEESKKFLPSTEAPAPGRGSGRVGQTDTPHPHPGLEKMGLRVRL